MKKISILLLVVFSLMTGCKKKQADESIFSLQLIQSGNFTNFYRSVELGTPFYDKSTKIKYLTPVTSNDGNSLTTGGLMDTTYTFVTETTQPSFMPMLLLVYHGSDNKTATFKLDIYKDDVLIDSKKIVPLTTTAANQIFTWTYQ